MSRLERLRALLADRELDGAIVSHPANRFWLSGWLADDHGPDESAGYLLVDRDRATLLTSPVNLPWAAAAVAPGVVAEGLTRPWAAKLGERLRELGWRRIGFEDRALTVADHGGIAEGTSAERLVPLGAAVDALREQKDPAELALLERALAITDRAFVEAVQDLRAGTTERALAWRIERLMRDLGADGPAFATIVAAGPHGARPHHHPTDRAIMAGEPVVIDMGARVGGYCADLTRTVCVGEPTERLRSIYNTVLAAQAAALAAIRPGLIGKDAHAVARGLIEATGHGDAFTHGLGHGLGIKVHEAPSLGETAEEPLRPGHVVTVEPGIYLEDWGGVRIEDVVVLEASGARNLTTAPKGDPRVTGVGA